MKTETINLRPTAAGHTQMLITLIERSTNPQDATWAKSELVRIVAELETKLKEVTQ